MNNLINIPHLTNQQFIQQYAKPDCIGLVGGTHFIDESIKKAQKKITTNGQQSLWSHAFIFSGLRQDGHIWLNDTYIFIYKIILMTVFLFQSCDTPLKIPQERRRTAIATVEDPHIYGNHGSSYALYVYYIRHERYEYKAPLIYGLVVGDKCLLEYDSLYLNKKHLMRENPIFLANEKTKFTTGTLIRVHKNYELINYIYKIHTANKDVEYERVQDLGLGNPIKNHPQLVNGATFLVEYWEKNPQRAILYIDKPIKDSTATIQK